MSNAMLTPTIFHEDWWLNVATGGKYDAAEVVNNGNTVGRMPYLITRRMGMKWAELPTLTHFLGPAVDEGPGSINKRFINRLEITRELISKLPRAHFMLIKCHRLTQDVIPFQEQKFRASVQFTHEIHPAPKDVLWSNLRHERRRVITRAEETLKIEPYGDVDSFLSFYSMNLGAKSMENKINMKTSKLIIEECLRRKRGEILVAIDDKNVVQAAIFCVWDAGAMYYLMTTRSQTSGNGAVSALIWRALQDASSRQLIFDLDGLAGQGSIMFYAGFGGVVRPRYVATRTSLPVYMYQGITRSFSDDYWFI